MSDKRLPPRFAGYGNGSVKWERLDSVDYESLGYLLSCHLIIEHYIDSFIKVHVNRPLGWDSARLTFSQKVSLISGSGIFKEPYDFIPSIKHLNSLRNKFSHNIGFKMHKENLLPMQQQLQKAVKESGEIPNDPHDILELYTSIVCAYLAGSLSSMSERGDGKSPEAPPNKSPKPTQ